MKNRLVYIIGASHAGKTTYAKELAHRCDGYYLEFDRIWNYQHTVSQQWGRVSSIIEMAMAEHGFVILDGAMYEGIWSLHETFPEARPILAYTDYKILTQRFGHMPPYDEDRIKDDMVSMYQSLINYYPSIVVSNDGAEHPSPQAFFAYLGNPWHQRMTDWLMSHIDAMEGDMGYTPIQLGATKRPGYERTLETWQTIKDLVDWKRRYVIEYGPHLAYAALHLYGLKAESVYLVEQSAPACNALKKMAHYLGRQNVEIINEDMLSYEVKIKPDVVMCLNMFYSLQDKKAGAQKLFTNKPRHIIVETNPEDFVPINEEANRQGYLRHTYPGRTNCNGHDRIIVHFEARHD